MLGPDQRHDRRRRHQHWKLHVRFLLQPDQRHYPQQRHQHRGLGVRYCTSLTGVYFNGNSPSLGGSVWSAFTGDNNATVYCLPGTTGWGSTFGGRPTALWLLPNPLILNNSSSFGVQSNGFGFIISWATNIPVVVEACTNLAYPSWSLVATNILTGGSSYFSDLEWTNYPTRLYRLRSP